MLNTEPFLLTLPIMAKGMAGIFIVTIALILLIKLINRVFPDRGGKR